MPRFFVDNIVADEYILTGENANHISKSLRMKIGDQITLCDGLGHDFFCEIIEISHHVVLKVIQKSLSKGEPNITVRLYQAMPKLDKLEFIIQKSVELGVSEITPVVTARCISRPDSKTYDKKLERYNKIALEAAKQCGRGIIPKVKPILNYQQAIVEMKGAGKAIVFYEHGGQSLNKIIDANFKDISILIGSEGGFNTDEIEYAKENQIVIGSLGDRILRCETAPICALSIMMHITGNI